MLGLKLIHLSKGPPHDDRLRLLSQVTVIHLTHWGHNKMTDIFHMTLSNTSDWMKTFEFHIKWHWIMFLGVYLMSPLVQVLVWCLTGDKQLHERTSFLLTHWGQVTHICVHNLSINGSNNSLSPGRHQAIVWTNAGILLIGPFYRNWFFFHSRKCIWKCRLQNGSHFVSTSMC